MPTDGQVAFEDHTARGGILGGLKKLAVQVILDVIHELDGSMKVALLRCDAVQILLITQFLVNVSLIRC